MRVMICDDEPSLRTLLRIALGLEPDLEVVAEAANGREAIDLAEQHRPDVILLDLAMPVMDGLEALPKLRAVAPDKGRRLLRLPGVFLARKARKSERSRMSRRSGPLESGGCDQDRRRRLSASVVFHAARRYVSVVGKNVLVISTVEHADDVLRAHVGEAETIKVVVPVVRQGVLDWLANDQEAIGHAERVAEHTADQLPGETVEAGAGEADVGLAIRDALATFPADEIVVAVRPEEEEGFVESVRLKPHPNIASSRECPSALS